eukprot:TRINITY_DN198_c0_g1_i6.p1 TRINITY_DN198_c0_g1~~TRINITY_DN198_c0_g1_i6.p1  ORF type:complete len:170 (+),score=41.82 TRINITY_DN198_c0_g1_i6:240-749(+)
MGPKKGGKQALGNASPDDKIGRWQAIYPAYLNKKLNQKQGRRVPLSKAVNDPTLEEISDILQHLKFKVAVEFNKAYSRDFFQRGRVRLLIREEGKPVNPELPNKRAVLYKLGELIPQLADRVKRAKEEAVQEAREAEAKAKQEKNSGGGGGNSGQGAPQKKSRRQRKKK